jgi:hypothetical protein
METLNTSETKKSKSGIYAIIIAVISFVISIITIYPTTLKSFSIDTYIHSKINIQYKNIFGLYIKSSFFNNSPKYGSITNMAVIISKTTNKEDKYLLTFDSFRILDEKGIGYKISDEKFPIFFKPRERQNKTINFLFTLDDIDFPISTGTYECDFLVYLQNEDNPPVISKYKFDILPSSFISNINKHIESDLSLLLCILESPTSIENNSKLSSLYRLDLLYCILSLICYFGGCHLCFFLDNWSFFRSRY